MADVKKNALLPTGEENELRLVASDLVDEGTHRAKAHLRVLVGIFDCRRVAIDADTGEEWATVRFRRVILPIAGDLPTLEKIIRRALEAHANVATLPLDLEDELEGIFRDMPHEEGGAGE